MYAWYEWYISNLPPDMHAFTKWMVPKENLKNYNKDPNSKQNINDSS